METKDRGELHAVLRKMEDGIYRAEYTGELNPENPYEREFPDFHVSTSMESARSWVEQMARGMGYSRVVWDHLPRD
jgi:hypothetical protein